MSTADLGEPILLFILICWTIIAVAAILTGLVKQGKISRFHIFDRWKIRHHHDPHHET